MTIKELVEESHAIAIKKGWWDRNVVRTFGDFCALLHTEISEAYEDYRNGRRLDEVYYEGEKPCGIPIEFADLMIRIADNAAAFGINLDVVVSAKMEYNKTRPYRHGGKKT